MFLMKAKASWCYIVDVDFKVEFYGGCKKVDEEGHKRKSPQKSLAVALVR